MRPSKPTISADRRKFLRQSAIAGAAGTAASAANASPLEAPAKSGVIKPEGYRDSDHVRAYYARARF